MTDMTNGKEPQAGRRLTLFLMVSLALNLALIGFVAGSFVRTDGARHAGERGPGLGAFGAPYVLALPREDRRAIRAALAQDTPGVVPTRPARRAMFEDVVDALRATPFDANALRDAVARQAAASDAVRTRAQDAWLTVVENMDDTERRAYAGAVEDILSRGPGRR